MSGSRLEALADEVDGQAPVLQGFFRQKLPRAPAGSVFVGAGDSYAAAVAGHYGSRGRSIALDPGTLAGAPDLARGAEVYFISVSGRTASNVLAAKRVRRVAKRTTAITAVGGSALAEATDDVIALPMSYAPRSPGFLSFSLSLVAVLKACGLGGRCDFQKALDWSRGDGGEIAWGRGTTYFLGSALGYAVALYCAAKTYELLGRKAHPELLEEFSHLELFSLDGSDAVDAFTCFDTTGSALRLARALARAGYESHVLPTRGRSELEALFHSVFACQLSVVARARAEGFTRPAFLGGRNRLRASDDMIYRSR